MKKILSTFIIFLTFFLLGAGYYFSTSIVSFPVTSLEEDKTKLKIESVADFGLPEPESIRFQNGSLRLRGWYFKNPKKKKCGVVLLHGHTRTRYGVLKYAPLFWKRGCSLFVYDARHHGESAGEYGTYGFYEKQDLERAIEFFSEISTVPEEQIGIFGASFGAATALQYAEGRNDFAFVIADSPYMDMRSIIEKRAVDLYSPLVLFLSPIALSIAELRADFLVDEVSPKKAAKYITIPVLIIHSRTDEFTPVSHSEEIYQNLKSNRKQLLVTDWGAKHCKSIDLRFDEYESVVNTFLKEKTSFPK
ncbi:alpha/beta hydrolase [Leptospira kanakyensis]|uniref:Alpha/beta fold hydrolase n=1 Tax=Leptospira kanakyensis TaxID=2484968 RepID=A0A6N4QFC4_9LEPT|nr:alpha/beta fold hydrolase [Leptospira kanakyensis]MCW7468198.1 alpha/beta fold hydrolase [Leptospira kanakyensis]MCW7482577.1 alpha/beta fold hydrolase [Leptospira kanakyensis]TGK55284.1 alpha/beta fold hydrolase [Leptospira kanakyensis]TGK60818.1 alpha/beta fold hydrolase [Leptospira kanakyensis]TGK76707.1 alpha/beta fold hydrolase [Leptospira kanakyensis]